VLERRALPALGLGDRVPEPPEGLGLSLAGGDRGVGGQPRLDRLGKRRSEPFGRVGRAQRRGRLDQHMPGVGVGQRRAHAGDMAKDQAERLVGDQLEALDRLA
jgi:hypothetical protein